MSGFSIDWLDLREPADRRARDSRLLEQAKQWLQTDLKRTAGMTVVDLGAGTGSTLRAFSGADLLELQAVSWHLVDQDPLLLAQARQRHATSHSIETHELDLADIASLPLAGAQLVTASALFDLVSATFIDMLAAAIHDHCRQQPLGFYAALNYDGTMRWTPDHPFDAAVLGAFNRDQHRDKGFGAALGPDAASYMQRKFKEIGFQVFAAESPWLLDGSESAMAEALIDGIGDAVATDPEIDSSALPDWIEFRRAHAVSGVCEVGHTDILALPKPI